MADIKIGRQIHIPGDDNKRDPERESWPCSLMLPILPIQSISGARLLSSPGTLCIPWDIERAGEGEGGMKALLQLKHEIPLLIYEERRCAARGQKRIHLDRTKTFCHHFIAVRRRLGSGSPFASTALPPMLSLPPSHLVCADLLPPRPPQRNASLCSRFTTDPSRVLSYLS